MLVGRPDCKLSCPQTSGACAGMRDIGILHAWHIQQFSLKKYLFGSITSKPVDLKSSEWSQKLLICPLSTADMSKREIWTIAAHKYGKKHFYCSCVLKRHVTYRINMPEYLLGLMLWSIFLLELVLWEDSALKLQHNHSQQKITHLRKTYLFKTSRNVQDFSHSLSIFFVVIPYN